MPNFISVVVPAYGVQGYLDECLDSVLRQQDVDAEVIGVDDASPDHCGVVLDEREARDPRLIAVHLVANVGPGPARNAGLDRATGEYVWFVDGDDRIVPGALAAVEARLRETAADVLVVGVAKERWNRSVQADSRRSPRASEVGTPGASDVLARSLPPVGALVVRRQFLLDQGIRFRAGWYEDVSFAFAVLLAGGTVATFRPACYISRLDRRDSIGTTASDRHVEAVDQYEHVLGLPALNASPKLKRRALNRATSHLLAILGDATRVRPADRRSFFARLSEMVRRHEPAGPKPGGVGGLRHRLISTDSYVLFELLRRFRAVVAAVVGGVRGAPARLAKRWRKPALRLYYRWQLLLPIDQRLAVYAAYWYRGYACNPAAVFERARELAPDVRGVWIVNRGRAASMPPGVDVVIAGTRAYYRAIARARWLVNNATFPPEVVKRPGALHVQTHHGTPLKTMGLDQSKFPASTVGFNAERLRRNIAKWDFSITANRHTTLLWDRQFPIAGETLEVGYPRNDRLASATPADSAAARAELGIAPGERVVVYAPTHREWHATFTPVLDVAKLADALGPNTRILLRGHYFYNGIGFPPQHPRVTDVSDHPSVETLYLAADVLITDFSSVMFDYAVLDKPLVIFAPDWEVYRAVRGVTFDLAAEPPGVFARTFEELVDAFRSGEVSDDRSAKARQHFRERFCSLEDGRAAERVVRRVFLGERLPATADREAHVNV